MRWIFRLFLLLLMLSPIALIGFAVMCTEKTPSVVSSARLSTANVERAKQLLHKHDPRKLKTGEIKTVAMSASDLNLVVNHLIAQLGHGGATFNMRDGEMDVAATVALHRLVPDRYLNIGASLREVDGQATFDEFRIGQVQVPKPLIGAISAFVIEHIYRASGFKGARDIIQAVAIKPSELQVTYQWQEGIADAVRNRLVSPEERAALKIYNDHLVKISSENPNLSFSQMIEDTFRLALKRSAEGNGVQENRAAIIVLAAYSNGASVKAFAPESKNWDKPRRIRMTLHGRRDFVKHFMTSAALAVTGGGGVADAVGLYKEIDDADGGSGFSFKDLLADKAGTKFGREAVANESGATRLQQRIMAGITDDALMPNAAGLDENMTDAVFKQRYGGVGAAPYRAVVTRMDSDIDKLAIYR